MRKSKFLSVLTATTLALTLAVPTVMPLELTTGVVKAVEVTTTAPSQKIEGRCGDNAIYSYDKATRTLTISGTGVGISLAANKVNGIRACVCSEPYSAKLSKQHNNTNIIAFGARVVGIELAKMIVDQWLEAEYEGGRHQVRIDMLKEIEEKQKNK